MTNLQGFWNFESVSECDSAFAKWKWIFSPDTSYHLTIQGNMLARPGHCTALRVFHLSVNSLHKMNQSSNVENLLKEGRDMK